MQRCRVWSQAAGVPCDGVVLIEDGYLHDLPSASRYLGLMPTVSATHTTHESTKDYPGIRAGVAAQVFGRKRVTITLEQARTRLEELRQEVAAARVVHNGKELPAITISVGVAAFPREGKDVAGTIKAADEALYRAKQNGRNRLEVAAGETAERSVRTP